MSAAANPAIHDEPSLGPIRYEFNQARNINFQNVLDTRTDFEGKYRGQPIRGILKPEANVFAMKLYNKIQRDIAQHKLRFTKASINLLICFREMHKEAKRRGRRDQTSTYVHEFAQIIYGIWIFENQSRVDKWLRERLAANDLHPMLRSRDGEKDKRTGRLLLRTVEDLDVACAVSGNHDSIEDLNLTRDRLLHAMKKVPVPANDNTARKITNTIINLTKTLFEPAHSWMRRAQKTELTLLCKLFDRTHNVATFLGSDRTEEQIKEYLDSTDMLLSRANSMIRKNGTLTYMAQYLYDQMDLLHLYYDVKHGRKGYEVLDECIKMLNDRYRTSTIDREIHPMLCIVDRIAADPDIRRNLPSLETILAPGPFDPQAVAVAQLKRDLGK